MLLVAVETGKSFFGEQYGKNISISIKCSYPLSHIIELLEKITLGNKPKLSSPRCLLKLYLHQDKLNTYEMCKTQDLFKHAFVDLLLHLINK